jgi:hypothetical protein
MKSTTLFSAALTTPVKSTTLHGASAGGLARSGALPARSQSRAHGFAEPAQGIDPRRRTDVKGNDSRAADSLRAQPCGYPTAYGIAAHFSDPRHAPD